MQIIINKKKKIERGENIKGCKQFHHSAKIKKKQFKMEIYRVKSFGNIPVKQRTKENDIIKNKLIDTNGNLNYAKSYDTELEKKIRYIPKHNEPNKRINPIPMIILGKKRNRKQKHQTEQRTLNTKPPTYEELIQQNNKHNRIIEKRLEDTMAILEYR